MRIDTKSALRVTGLLSVIAGLLAPYGAGAAPVTSVSGTDYEKGVFSLIGAENGGTEGRGFGFNISGGPSSTEINLFHIATNTNLAGFTGDNEDGGDPLRLKSLLGQFLTTGNNLPGTSISHATRKNLVIQPGVFGLPGEEPRPIDASAIKVAAAADYTTAQGARARNQPSGGLSEDIPAKPERITALDRILERVKQLGPNEKIAIILAVALTIAGIIIWLT